MRSDVGVWIDHKKAVIATIAGKTEALRQLTSDMEKHVRYSGAPQEDSAEDQRDRRYTGHLDKYYDEVVACLRDAESILILGPGEAKGELKKRLAGKGLKVELQKASLPIPTVRLTAGPFSGKAVADKVAAQLKGEGLKVKVIPKGK